MTDFTNFNVFATEAFTNEDVEQEMALFRLEHSGKGARRDFIVQQLTRKLGGFSFSYEDPEDIDFCEIPFLIPESSPLSSSQIEQLLHWGASQSDDLQDQLDVLLGYAEGDKAKAFEILMQSAAPKVKGEGAEDKAPSRSSFIRSEILDQLRGGSLTRGQLILLLQPAVQRIYQARRPEAAIRQALRSLVEKGLILQESDSFRLANS